MKKNQQGKNSNLHQAKREKNDEFYTQLSDIENELKHYREHFQGKIIFCNCDDPYESNFFKYFALNFNRFWLKKLIGMGYAISLIVGMEVPLFEIAWYEEPQNKAYKIEVNQVKDSEDWVFDLEDIKLLIKQNREFIKVFPLKGNGDLSFSCEYQDTSGSWYCGNESSIFTLSWIPWSACHLWKEISDYR